MFLCIGWCFPWTLAAVGGSAICIRNVRDKEIFKAFRDHKVTHFCGAPVVLNTLLNAPVEYQENVPSGIKVMTAGAAPPASVIKGMESLGFEVIQVYGLTETYGPMIVSEWREEWEHLPPEEKSRLKARQGVQSIMAGSMMVGDPSTMEEVPWDGETKGEVFMRGNIVMKGYLKNKKTTEKCFEGGWFLWRHSCMSPQRLHRNKRPNEGHHNIRRRKYLHASKLKQSFIATLRFWKQLLSRSLTRSGESIPALSLV